MIVNIYIEHCLYSHVQFWCSQFEAWRPVPWLGHDVRETAHVIAGLSIMEQPWTTCDRDQMLEIEFTRPLSKFRGRLCLFDDVLVVADIVVVGACGRQKCMENPGFVSLCFQWLQVETPTEETKEVKEVKEVKANVVWD